MGLICVGIYRVISGVILQCCFLFVFDSTKMHAWALCVQTQILRLLPKYLAGNSAFFLIFALLLSVLIHTETI